MTGQKPRRPRGQGTQLPDGRWQVRMRLPGGKTKAFYGKTLREAQRKRAEAKQLLERGYNISNPRLTVGEYLEQWLRDVVRPAVRPNVYHRYEINVRKHLVPALGHIRLDRLAAENVDALKSQLLASGLAPRTVKNIHATLRNALNAAVARRRLTWNPAAVSGPPRVEKPSHQRLTPEQSILLLDRVAGTPLECIVTLALTTGLREGELLGLKWEDVDLDAGVIRVRRQMQRIPGEGWRESEPKSATSRRSVLLTPLALAALERQRAAVAELRERARLTGEEWDGRYDLVHPNQHGRPIEKGNLLRRWRRFLAKNGLPPMRFHDLRHSTARLLLALKVPLRTIQEILGHSQISTTSDIYGDEVAPLHAEAMSLLNALLARDRHQDRHQQVEPPTLRLIKRHKETRPD